MDPRVEAYNAPDFALKLPDLMRLGETIPLRVGVQVPDFSVHRLDGGTFHLAVAREREDVVLMMGSITSPMCSIHVPRMNALAERFGPLGIGMYMLYTRESHPGEHYPHHTSFEQKVSFARDLARLEHVRFPILVDALDGRVHRQFGSWPTSLFVIRRDGVLVYRSTIADPVELAGFLEQLNASRGLQADSERVPHVGYTERLLEYEADEPAHYRVYDRAGPKAFEDYWQAFPRLRGRWPANSTE